MTRTLRDGTPLLLRRLRPQDREWLREAYLGLSPESRYSRFLAGVPALTPRMLHQLVDHVDFVDHHALVLLTAYGDEIGIGRWVRDPARPDTAEAAFTIADRWHGQWAGSALVDGMVQSALDAGITTFTATLLTDNTASLRLLERTGEIVVRDLQPPGAVSVEVRLRPPPMPPPPSVDGPLPDRRGPG